MTSSEDIAVGVLFERIERYEANDALVRWEHRHGPLNRPRFAEPIDYGLREAGNLVAVVCADTLIRPTCGLDRSGAFEVSRVCAARVGLSSTALRMWRHFAFPSIATAFLRAQPGWAISYQDSNRHGGDLYRGDGWIVIGWSTGGPDPRAAATTENVRRRVIWGWNPDRDLMRDRRDQIRAARKEKKWPDWAERAAA